MSINSKYKALILLLFIGCLFSCSQGQEAITPKAPATSFDGVSIDYLVSGKGDVAIILIHGWSCDKSYWEKQLIPLAERYKVVTIDLGGHGNSGLNRADWTMDSFGEDVVAVVKKLELKKVILVGHSMGGRVIIEAAQRLPNEVIGLIGVDTWADLVVKTPEQANEIVTPFRENFVETARIMASNMFLEDADSSYVERIVSDMSSAPSKVAISSGLNYQLWKAPEEFDKIQLPLKLIIADRSFNPSAKMPSGIDVDIMENVGHFLMMDDPDTFHRLLFEDIEEIISESK